MEKVAEKIKNLRSAIEQTKKWKMKGQKIVFTNGCFDILHAGHIDYLEKAKNLGEKLIVGVNTDKSIARIKGKKRPIQDQHSRGMILASLQFVDLVVFFDEDTPLSLISKIIPDILVKGGDYLTENIIGSEIVLENKGMVKKLDFVPGYSTTRIIEKIKKT